MPRAPRRVVWAPKAKQDLRDIWRYFARVASPDIADNLLRDIDRAAAGLDVGALQWRARDDVMPGLRSVRAHPYTLFYRMTDGELSGAGAVSRARRVALRCRARRRSYRDGGA